MSLIGGNLEKKEIGLALGVSGTYKNTEIDKTTGHLRLTQIDVDSTENPIYAAEGSWTSDVINLGDIFNSYEKVFTTNTMNGSSSFAVLTRVSDNGANWSDWLPLAMDGTIQSDMKQYIQVRIDLFAGFVSDEFVIVKGDFEDNEFVEKKIDKSGGFIVPKLTSNTSSSEGFAFASSIFSTSYSSWNAFDKTPSTYFSTVLGNTTGFLGFYFNSNKKITKYKITSPSGSAQLKYMPKSWILQASNDTSDGINGTWWDLNTQSNQTWNIVNTDKEFEFTNQKKYHAYRINWTENNGDLSYSGIGELDFFEEDTISLSLKRKYAFKKILDSTYSDFGSLHSVKINRDRWLRIDRLEVK